jgi:peptidoglycan/xylan/chitin deacetylase (PgdA/CDA1 family)
MYHRIAELRSDPWSLCVSPKHFQEHLELLQKWGEPAKLSQLTYNGEIRIGRPRTFVVTFDDGYADFLNAKPLLERFSIPATIFAVSGNINGCREFWWDRLEYLLLTPGILPQVLSVQTNETLIEFDLGEWSAYTQEAYQENLDWKTWQAPPTKRHAVFYSLWELLRTFGSSDRNRALDSLFLSANIENTNFPEYAILTDEQLSSLNKGELIEIGCHSVTHQKLSALTRSEQEAELRQSKNHLETILNCPVSTFAYPFGGIADFSKETVELVRYCGFQCGCTTIPGLVYRDSDLYQLPRMYVGDWSAGEFQKQLNIWFTCDSQ